jgi:hypothetical protein
MPCYSTNINPDFVTACPAVMTFMRSDVALSVFLSRGGGVY